MKHTNEFLRGMFSAYMGCDVINTDEGKHLKMIAISGYFISVYEPPYPFCESEGDEYEWMFSESKPILNPLSEITDEDAVEVAKIMEIPQFERSKLFGCDENNYYTIGRHIKNEIIETCYNDGFYLQGAVIDYLRSKHYDCGYMHIQSLIAADLAISSKTNIT